MNTDSLLQLLTNPNFLILVLSYFFFNKDFLIGVLFTCAYFFLSHYRMEDDLENGFRDAYKKKKVCIVGGGAAGMAAAWSLAKDEHKRFEIVLMESAGHPGGVATSEKRALKVEVADPKNDQASAPIDLTGKIPPYDIGERAKNGSGSDSDAGGSSSSSMYHKIESNSEFEGGESSSGEASVNTMKKKSKELSVMFNGGVQGGAKSYAHTLHILKMLQLEPNWVDVKVSFGTGDRQWSNHAEVDNIITKHKKEIGRFGKILWWMDKLPVLFAFLKIKTFLWLFRFSESFGNDIIFPLTALFFGTGNQTANVSSTIFAEVFNNPKLRLYDYDHERFLGKAPKMFAFPSFYEYYDKYMEMIRSYNNSQIYLNTKVHSVNRKSRSCKGKKIQVVYGTNHDMMEFDDIIFCCNSETTNKILQRGSGAGLMEKFIFSNIKYYDDITVTHTDHDYMKKLYDIKQNRNDMYFVRTYDKDRSKIEMSFNLSNYQPSAKIDQSDIYQTIFLNKEDEKSLWTDSEISPTKILLKKWWRQFSHSVRHFTMAVPFWRFVQGSNHTYHAGSYTLVNTHEIATISGFAAAYRLGAEHPFLDGTNDIQDEELDLALMQFDLYLKLIHGKTRGSYC